MRNPSYHPALTLSDVIVIITDSFAVNLQSCHHISLTWGLLMREWPMWWTFSSYMDIMNQQCSSYMSHCPLGLGKHKTLCSPCPGHQIIILSSFHSSRVAVRRDTCCIVAISLNIMERTHPIIWSLGNLPFDCLKTFPVPKPIGE